MAGKIKRMLDQIIAQRSKGNETLVTTTRAKLILKGIAPDEYTNTSPDDAAIIAKLRLIANDLGVSLSE